MAEYDAVVIGMGTAGEGVVSRLNSAGLKTAAIECELVGGLCAYWGCMPSKTLLRPGEIVSESEHEPGLGRPLIDWNPVREYRNYMARDWDDSGQVERLRKEGVDFFRGLAKIEAPGRVEVGGQKLQAKRMVITTGSEPIAPLIPGLAEVGYWTNREGTDFQEVPQSVLIIGGGPVGSELGQAFRRLGAEVSIVEESGHILGREDPEAAEYVQAQFRSEGIQLYLGRKARKFERRAGKRSATLDDGQVVEADVVLVGTGRGPRIGGLGLDKLGIEPSRRGIEVDSHCRAAAKSVWAAGDVTGVAGFTHVAHYQSQIVADDILGQSRQADYSAIPRVTFTDPEVASVGMTQPDGNGGREVVTASADLNTNSRAYTYGKGYRGGLKLLADAKKKTLIGAWAVGPLAGEWLQWATLAIKAQTPVDVLDDTILAFPTFTRLYLSPLADLRRQLYRS